MTENIKKNVNKIYPKEFKQEAIAYNKWQKVLKYVMSLRLF